MKKYLLLFIIGVAIIVVLILASSSKDKGTITVPAALGLTGEAASWAEEEKNALTMLADTINSHGGIRGQKLAFTYENTGSTSEGSIGAMKRIASTNPFPIIMGPTWLDTFPAAGTLASEKSFVAITPSGAITASQLDLAKPNPYIFSTWYRSDLQAVYIANHLLKEGKKTTFIAQTKDPFWADFMKRFADAYTAGGGIIVGNEATERGGDLKSVLSKIKNVNPSAVVFGYAPGRDLEIFFKQRASIYPEGYYVTTENIAEYTLRDDMHDAIKGIVYVTPNTGAESDFVKDYQAKYGITPLTSARTMYAAGEIVVDYLRDDSTPTATEARAFIANKKHATTMGDLSFDSIGGIAQSDFQIITIQ